MNRADQCYQCSVVVTPSTINFAWCSYYCRSLKYKCAHEIILACLPAFLQAGRRILCYHIQHIRRTWRASKTVIFCFIDVVKWKSQSHYFRFSEYCEAIRTNVNNSRQTKNGLLYWTTYKSFCNYVELHWTNQLKLRINKKFLLFSSDLLAHDTTWCWIKLCVCC